MVVFVELAGLASAVSVSLLGLELYDGVDPAGAATALDAVEQLGVLIGVVDDLGPVARRARERACVVARVLHPIPEPVRVRGQMGA